MNRRSFIKSSVAASLSAPLAGCAGFPWRAEKHAGRASRGERRYHLSVSPKAILQQPDLLQVAGDAGVTDFWLASFMYGNWLFPIEQIEAAANAIRGRGWNAHLVNVPLGHPDFDLSGRSGRSLSVDSPAPQTPANWPLGVRPDGRKYAGVALHEPITAENAAALRRLSVLKPDKIFLDDDFRLAPSPGDIGGCFCDAHQKHFLDLHGYSGAKWQELLDAVNRRELTPLLREWQEFVCDELRDSFRVQQAAIPRSRLGIMVMYLGAEKAGIRLADYRDCPFRVGELMFDNSSFASVKGKTDELFSALFHRRLIPAKNAYSETTAYPPGQLSAQNLAAKLIVSTIADVPNTMFMSGLDPFPLDRWLSLKPAMHEQTGLHARVAGCRPRGPLKHFWGEWARRIGVDKPYSLFLATGIPFEVIDKPTDEGCIFLGDGDAKALSRGALKPGKSTFVCRPGEAGDTGPARIVPENLQDLFAFKREIVNSLRNVPYLEEDHPAVCAWYPGARGVLIWNLAEQSCELTLRLDDRRQPVSLPALGAAFVEMT